MPAQASKSNTSRMVARPAGAGRFALGVAGVACAALITATGLGVSVATFSSDNLVFGGFERAFASRAAPYDTRAQDGAAHDVRRVAAYDGIAASEDFWLAVGAQDHAKIGDAVAVGREIIVTNAAGQLRLTVTDVREVSQAATHITNRDGAARVLHLTCREADAGSVREIRLILDDESGQPVSAPATPAVKAVPTT